MESFEGRDGVSPQTTLKRISVGSANIVFFLWEQREREREKERERERERLHLCLLIHLYMSANRSVHPVYSCLSHSPSVHSQGADRGDSRFGSVSEKSSGGNTVRVQALMPPRDSGKSNTLCHSSFSGSYFWTISTMQRLFHE